MVLVGALIFQVANVVVNEVDFNPEFISRMIPKVEWPALLQAAEQVTTNKIKIILCNSFCHAECNNNSG